MASSSSDSAEGDQELWMEYGLWRTRNQFQVGTNAQMRIALKWLAAMLVTSWQKGFLYELGVHAVLKLMSSLDIAIQDKM